MIRPAVFLGCLLLTPSCGATDSHQYTVGFANSGRRPVLGQRQNSVAVATRWKQQHSVIFDLRGGDYASSLLGHQNQVDSFLNAIDLFGTGIFAFSGAVTAGRKGMDILGMWIISIVTSLGGGTLRDILLDTGTVFWMEQAIYVQISSITVLATFLFWPTLEKRYGWKDSALPICLADALGLAAFAVLGTQKGVQMGLHPIMWVVCGLMSACFGGITRDVLCAQPPRVMYHSRSMYAQAPLLGSILYTILTRYCKWIDTQIVASLSFLLAFITRVVFFNNPSWKMPHWKQSDK